MKISGRPSPTLRLLAVLGLLGAAGTAQAGGLYLLLGGGQVNYTDGNVLTDACATISLDCPVDETDTGFRAGLGWQFNEFMALEASYDDLGEMSAKALNETVTARARVQAANISLVPSVPIGKHLSLYGKAGAFATYLDLSADAPSLGLKDSVDGGAWGLAYGGGVAVHLGPTATVRLEYERYNIDDKVDLNDVELDVNTNIDFISANLLLRFN